MKTIKFHPFFHRGGEKAGLMFEKDFLLNKEVRKIRAVKWSQTHGCWYIPLDKDSCEKAIQYLKPFAKIDTKELKEYLLKKKRVDNTLPGTAGKRIHKPVFSSPAWNLSTENLAALEKFVEQMKLKAYSESTIRTYRNEFMQLLRVLKNKPVNELAPDDLRRYMVYAMEKEGINENTAHSRLNALKFYFEQVLNREKYFCEIPRPKKPMLLPKVLGEDDLGKLFKALTNIKHKAMLFTAYSAGLRVSEVAALKIKHIDSDRMQILVEQAKGKKDRYVTLSPVLLDILRSYIKNYKPKPKVYLFESEQSGDAYPVRTIQRIFQLAKARSGIHKEVGIHSLRHSFATHLMEKGTDIRYIKDLLGHFDIRTTERYLHVSRKELVNIINPLDDLWRKGKIDW